MTPSHFYFPIPNLNELDDSVWTVATDMVGIDMDLDGQEKLVDSLARQFLDEYQSLNTKTMSPKLDAIRQLYFQHYTYRRIDGFLLFAMIRSMKPRRLVEIGAGGSTLLSLLAGKLNEAEGSHPIEITAIEPYPAQYIIDGLRGNGELIKKRVEKVPLSFL